MQGAGTGTGAWKGSTLPPAGVQTYLNELLSPGRLALSPRRARLFRYLIDRSLAGQEISEYGIGLDVFDKPTSFDPRLESTVRSEMTRLRKSLDDYYARGGSADPFRIEFPNRTYAPQITVVQPESATAVEEPPAPARHRRWLWMALGAAAVSGVALLTVSRLSHPLNSVVVLPFENLTGDANNQYLADGVTEQVTDALAQTPSLRVVARTSAFQFKNTGIDVREVGRKLNVEAVVEGSLRKFENGYRLTVQVNRTADGYHILSRTFDGKSSELALLESEIAPPVLAALRAVSPPGPRHVPNADAYDLYLRSSYVTTGRLMPDHYARAVTLLQEAIERDPNYAEAYAALASTYVVEAANSSDHPREILPLAKAAAEKALALDPLSDTAIAAAGFTRALMLDWRGGEADLRRALRLAPAKARVHSWLGTVLYLQGRFPEAIAELRTVQTLDPLNNAPTLARTLYMARRYDEAVDEAARWQRSHPDARIVHLLLGQSWEAKGAYDKALAEYQQVEPGWKGLPGTLAHLYAKMGQRQKALQMLAEMEHPRPGSGPPLAYHIAIVYAGLGDKEKAFEWLNRAYENEFVWLIKVEPRLDPLRGDARFDQLLKRAGFTE